MEACLRHITESDFFIRGRDGQVLALLSEFKF